MKIDFSQVLKTRKGDPIMDNGFETAILSMALKLRKETDQINSVLDATAILIREKVALADIVKERGEPMTLRDVCCLALDSGIQGEQLDHKEKRKLGQMADRIWGALEPIDMKAEDIATLKERIAKIYLGNRIPHLACELLDPEPEEK